MFRLLRKRWKRARDRRRVLRVRSGRDSRPPVLIYQMGKVGSSTIQATLRATGELHSFQFHQLNPGPVASAVTECRRRQRPLPRRLERSVLIYKHIIQPRIPAKIVTLVREPIGVNISAYFENLDRLWQIKRAHEHLTMDALIQGFFEKYRQTTPLAWFDDEFRSTLDIDVYQFPFPTEERYVQFTQGPYDVLIMRVDLDDATKAACLKRFLGLEHLRWVSKNSSDTAAYGQVYQSFKRNIRFPPNYVRSMLDAKFTRHFFNPSEIVELERKWQHMDAPPRANVRS